MRTIVSRHCGSLVDAVEPLVGEPGAAGESDRAIHDYDFAVRAIIGARPGVPAQRVVPGDAAAGALELSKRFLGKPVLPTASMTSRTSTPASARCSRACTNGR